MWKLTFVLWMAFSFAPAHAGESLNRQRNAALCALTVCVAGALNWLACRVGDEGQAERARNVVVAPEVDDSNLTRIQGEMDAITAERMQGQEYLDFQRETLASSVTAEAYFRKWADFWKLGPQTRIACLEEVDRSLKPHGLRASEIQFPTKLNASEQERLTIFTQFLISSVKLKVTRDRLMRLGTPDAAQLERVKEGERVHELGLRVFLGKSPFKRENDEPRD